MSLEDRIKLYSEIEAHRGRPLLVYVTSSRPNATGRMAADAIPELLDQVEHIPRETKAVDLLVVSQGGDPTVAWRIMCLLRERFQQIGVLVPQSAFSAATLLCLGADEIWMHPNGNLGPVDPQVTFKKKSKQDNESIEVRFGYEEVVSFVHFVRERAHITDQKELATLLAKLLDDIGSVSVGYAVRGSMLSQSLGENLLRMHMTNEGDATKAKEIAEKLNKKFLHHGYAVGRNEARDIALKVKEGDHNLESLMWRVWKDLESEIKMRQAFNPMAELAASPGASALFAPLNSINLPQGLPPALAQQVFQQLAGQLQIAVTAVPPLDTEVVYGVMESTRICSRCVGRRRIQGNRQHDGSVTVIMADLSQGWENVSVPAIVPSANTLPLPRDTTDVTITGATNTSQVTATVSASTGSSDGELQTTTPPRRQATRRSRRK